MDRQEDKSKMNINIKWKTPKQIKTDIKQCFLWCHCLPNRVALTTDVGAVGYDEPSDDWFVPVKYFIFVFSLREICKLYRICRVTLMKIDDDVGKLILQITMVLYFIDYD